MDLYSTLKNSARRSPDAAALVFKGNITTYSRLLSAVDRFCAGLAGLGISRGDKLALMMRNSPEFVITYYAAAKMGAVVVPINFMLKSREVEYIISNSGAIVVVAQETYLPIIRDAIDKNPSVRFVVTTSGTDSTIPFEDLLNSTGTVEESDFEDNTLASILYTSGTTGKPKGAMLSHGNLISNVASCEEALLAAETDVFMCLLPMFHTFAWTTCVLLPIYLGLPTVIIESIQPFGDIAKQIIAHKVTLMIAVPQIFGAFTKIPLDPRAPALPLRICVAGAAPLPGAIKEAFEAKFGIPLIEGYGLTESSPVVSFNPLRGENRTGTAGVCIPGVEVKIVDDAGVDITGAGVGEICVRGKNVMLGYHNDPEATREALDEDGWLHTGDIGRVQRGGYIEIVDRKKDMILVKGLNVYSREVEDVLMMYPGVEECAVIGVPDETGGELVHAFVTAREEVNIDKADLSAFCRKHLAVYKVPKKITFTAILPKNAVGKILKRELREMV